MNRRVVITGLGTTNPIGNDPEETWARASAGLSGIGHLSQIDTRDLKTRIGGRGD